AIDPCRVAVSGFDATEKDTVPFPAPLDPDVMVIHELLLAAPQEHVAPAATEKLPVPPAAGTDLLVGEMDVTHVEVGPACSTVSGIPAIVSVAVRGPEPFLLDVTPNPTVALPLPPVPKRLIHGALLLTVHPHPSGAVTLTEPVPPAIPNESEVGSIEKVHGGGGGGGGGAVEEVILKIVPPRPTTYSSPASSSPNDDTFIVVSSSSVAAEPSYKKISPVQ